MRKRVLFINPPIHDFSAYDLWMKPLGLLYAASLLKSHGYEVGLVDAMDRFHPAVRARASGTSPRKREFGCSGFFAEEIPKPSVFAGILRRFKRFGLPPAVMLEEIRRRPRPDLIAVTSMMTYWYPGVFEAIALAKQAFPGVPVVLGGVYATLCADHARACSGADVVVTGPAEESFPETVCKLGGGVRGEAAQRSWANLRPAYHLMPNIESVSILTSRGCPFRCSYCASRLLSSGLVQRDPVEVAEEIESYVRRGIRDVAFYDDALLVNAKGHLLETLRLLDRRNVHVRFHTPNGLHIRWITQEVALALRAADFCTLRLSFETASEARQRDSDRKVANQDLQMAIENLLAAGFSLKQMEVYIMFGLPGQGVREVADTMAFVHQCGGRIKLVQFSPIPGTPEFERSAEDRPALRTEPLLHNKTAFHQLGGPFHLEAYEGLKQTIDLLNASCNAGRTLGAQELVAVLKPFRN